MTTEATLAWAFGLFLACHALATAADMDADRQVRQLGDPKFAVREAAAKKLAAMDLAALPALRKAQANPPDLEVRRRVARLIDQIGAKHGFVEVDGVEYRTVTAARWAVPAPMNSREVKLGLRVANVDVRTRRVSIDRLSVKLVDSAGDVVWGELERKTLHSPPLPAGVAHTFRFAYASLLYPRGGPIVLWVTVPEIGRFNGYGNVHAITAGKHVLTLTFHSGSRRVDARPVEVEIR